MRKLTLVPLALGFSLAIHSGAFGQGINYTANPSSPALNSGGLAMPGQNASQPKSGNNSPTDDEDDPSLQRLKSTESMGEMSRDEGQLTAKARRREKISKVESTKQLHTSGSDPKFQSSLLHSSVSSISDVGEKANSNPAASPGHDADDANSTVVDQSDPRFKAKRLVFTPTASDDSKTRESQRTKADSSPSPSPSPSASVTPSSH